VQMFHMRQRWGAAVWRAQTQVLLGRLSMLHRGGKRLEAESRRAADTAEARQLQVARQWVWRRWGGLTDISAGVLGTAATWVASSGARVAVWESCTDTAPGSGLWGTGPCFFGGQAALPGCLA
jgi:hypothetical protein